MKIIIITNSLGKYSGWERYSFDLVSGLVNKGHEVIVVCHKIKEEIPGVAHISILPGPLQFKKNFLLAQWYQSKIVSDTIKLTDADCVHCVVEPYACIASGLARRLKKPLVVTLHGSYALKTLRNPLYRILQYKAYTQATKIVSISTYTRKRLEKYKKFPNVTVIPNGVQAGFINSQSQAVRNEKLIIGVGAVKHRKGYHIVLEALTIVKQKIPDFDYRIIGSQGDTEYVALLRDYIQANNLENNVRLESGISDAELKNLYSQAKLFVLMPVSDEYNFEGFGLVYLEANAHGLPVIGSYDSGAEEAIQNSISGYLINPQNSRELADRIMHLLSNEAVYQNMSKGALEWAKSHTWDKIINQYLDVYRNK